MTVKAYHSIIICPAQPFDDKYKFSFVGESQGEHSHGATTYSASLAQPFDDMYNFNLAGEHSHGATTYGASGKFSPRSVLFSPTHLPQIASPPSYTDLPLSDAKPPLLSPKPQKAFVSPSESATTSAVPTMASPAPAFVPAAVDSFQSSWKPEFPPLDQNEQQQMT
ncbi:hypothetical protein MRX96_009967 [Rhipicephalus microplus]